MPTPREQQDFVRAMFDRIARRYDLLNSVISFRLDSRWRKKAVRALGLGHEDRLVLDLGTGTGDLALQAAGQIEEKARIVGLDISLEMLRLAQAKKERRPYGGRTVCVLGSALDPPLKGGIFDAIMTAFVLRNIPDLDLFFHNAYRLLRPGGRMVALDMYPPSGHPFSFFYALYFYRLVPWIGAGLAHDRSAYQYLSDSVKTFKRPETVGEIMQKAGFEKVKIQRFLKGAVCLHMGEKSPPAAGRV